MSAFVLTNEGCEARALGCILLSEQRADFLQRLSVDHFAVVKHRAIFEATRAAILDGLEPDAFSVHKRVREPGIGLADVAAIQNSGFAEANFDDYLATLSELRDLRQFQEAGVKIPTLAIGRKVLAAARAIADRPEEVSVTRPKGFTIWKPSQFLEYVEPTGNHLLLPAYLSKGELATLIGQGGLGKTRLALWLAICQIIGREWCGLQTGGEPQRWLVLGDENSVARIKGDLGRMLANLTDGERAKVEELLRIQAVLGDEDNDLNLGDPEVQARVRATLEELSPGGLVVDPLVNIAPGDISKPGDMKEAIRLLMSTIRKSAPSAATLLLHHSRMGRQNIAQGVGWDAGNFASGGKSLFAAARCQLNLMPGRADDDTRLVISCGKANNCERFAVRGLIFDPERFTYIVDPDFDSEAWKADVEGKARMGQSLLTLQDVVGAVRDGYSQTSDLVEHLKTACATSKSSVERMIRRALDADAVKLLCRGRYTLGRKSGRYLEQVA